MLSVAYRGPGGPEWHPQPGGWERGENVYQILSNPQNIKATRFCLSVSCGFIFVRPEESKSLRSISFKCTLFMI